MSSSPTALTRQQVNSWPVSTKGYSISGERVTDPKSTPQDKDQILLKLAIERFKVAVDAESQRRAEMKTDLDFYLGNQWDPAVKAKRQKGETPRPCLEINRIQGFVKHVVNNMRQSRPDIQVKPVGDGADEDQAEIRQGLIRHIETNSQADVSYDTAFMNMCIHGLGWIRIVDDWAGHDSFDKDLFIRWVSNSFQVYVDPDAALPDWSDMQYAFVVEDLNLQEFSAKYGLDKARTATTFQSTGDHGSYWYPGGKIRVAEYFYVEYTKDQLVKLSDGTTLLFSDLPVPLPDGVSIVEQREVQQPIIRWALITASEVLEKRTWKGRYIPLIPVIGNQIDKDGERIIVGMVRYARDPQRAYNYAWSSFMETLGLAPRSQFIAEYSQIASYISSYERANTDPQAVLPYDAKTSESGQLFGPPQRISASPDLGAFVEAINVADQQMKAVFSIYDASLGQKGPQESGLAINARKIESDTGTYDWGDNFIRAIRYMGIVLNDLLPFYYNDPARQKEILREDKLLMKVILDREKQQQEEQALAQASGQPVGGDGAAAAPFDLSKGRYASVISTGPSQVTRRTEAASSMLELAKVYPPLMRTCGDLVVRELDWPGKDEIAARLAKALPPGLKDPDPNAPPIPPEVQAQIVQMQGMVQQLSQALHQATDKNEIQHTKELFETFRAQMNAETQLAIASVKVGSDEAKFLNQQIFAELQQLRTTLEPHLLGSLDGTPPAQSPAQPSAPAPPPNLAAPPQTSGGVPPTVGGQ